MRRERCPKRHRYGAPCEVCGGSTVITTPHEAPSPPDPDLIAFLTCSNLLEAHGILPHRGGWLDQSAWFCEAHLIYQGAVAAQRAESERFDAECRERERRRAERAGRRR